MRAVRKALAPQGYAGIAGVAAPKAGVNRRLGRSPRVRGVATNPNDHPHGGRTKAVKYPRTPWGRTTRFPRPTRPKLKLKALAKRRRRLA